jgi:sRNA-binding protein
LTSVLYKAEAEARRLALKAGAPRIDLKGQPAGVVSGAEAAHARTILEARR